MKIAFLHMTMGLIERGSEISVGLIANELAKKNDVFVAQSGPIVKSIYKRQRIYPLDYTPLSAPNNLLKKILFRLHLNSSSIRSIFFTLSSLNTLKKIAPNIIVATNGGNQVRILRAAFPHSMIVVFGRAGIGHDDLANLNAKPNLFIALSQKAYDWAKRHADPNTRVEYLPNPIDLSNFNNVVPVSLNMSKPVLLIVGALTKYKNIIPLVKVVNTIPVNLIIIGDGEQADELFDVLSSYQGEFRWIKHVDPVDLPSYYAAANAFAFLPDPQEAFGRVYLEAMAAGLPIVAPDDPIRRSIVGTKGYYAQLGDGDDIVIKVKEALASKRKDYSKELAQYDVKLISNKLITLFKQL